MGERGCIIGASSVIELGKIVAPRESYEAMLEVSIRSIPTARARREESVVKL